MPDASGTPSTNYSFPTFNTAADNPSGDGFNTFVADIDTKLAAVTTLLGAVARVKVANEGSLVGTRRQINFHEGSNIDLTIADDSGNEEVDVTIALSSSANTVQLVDALPGSPVDGDQIDLVVEGTLTAPTAIWRFRYIAETDDAYKWHFVGGSSLVSQDSTPTTLSGWANMTPAITLPVGGYFIVEGGLVGTQTYLNGGYIQSGLIVNSGSLIVSSMDGATAPDGTPSTAGNPTFKIKDPTARAASDVYHLQGSASIASGSTSYEWLTVTPVRVG